MYYFVKKKVYISIEKQKQNAYTLLWCNTSCNKKVKTKTCILLLLFLQKKKKKKVIGTLSIKHLFAQNILVRGSELKAHRVESELAVYSVWSL